jgi:hypothetical protein
MGGGGIIIWGYALYSHSHLATLGRTMARQRLECGGWPREIIARLSPRGMRSPYLTGLAGNGADTAFIAPPEGDIFIGKRRVPSPLTRRTPNAARLIPPSAVRATTWREEKEQRRHVERVRGIKCIAL